jgi:hypothetical protein
VSAEWRHREHPTDPSCVWCNHPLYDGDLEPAGWPCDAERMRVERDAAIRRAEDAEGRVAEFVALLTTSGRTPPPLNDYGLLSTLAFYAGPNARTAVDPRRAARVTQLSELVRASQESQKPPETPPHDVPAAASVTGDDIGAWFDEHRSTRASEPPETVR